MPMDSATSRSDRPEAMRLSFSASATAFWSNCLPVPLQDSQGSVFNIESLLPLCAHHVKIYELFSRQICHPMQNSHHLMRNQPKMKSARGHKSEAGLEYMQVPFWNAGHGIVSGLIWMTNRPSYCDRGRILAHTDLPLDGQEGWPRYYFNRNRAKLEIAEWLAGRKEIKA